MWAGFRRLFFGGVLGKVLGLAREVLLAALLGTGSSVAAYRVSQTAALIPINLLNADLLAVGFLPQHARVADNPRLAWALYAMVRNWVVVTSCVIFVALAAFSGLWIGLLAPGFPDSTAATAAIMLVLTAASVPFYAYFMVVSYLAMARGDYRPAALRPALQSTGLIVATIVAFATGNPVWLAAGFLAAYVAMAAWALLVVRRLRAGHDGAGPAAASADERRELRHALWVAIRPYLLVPLVVQGVWVAERVLTSLISTVAVAALDYARVITDTIIALIAAPLGLSVLASLSGAPPARRASATTSLIRGVLVVGVPASAVLVVAGPLVVAAVFGRGAFGGESVSVTSAFLVGLSFGLWAQLAGQVLIRVLNSEGRNRAAAIAVATGAAVTIAVDIALYRPLGALGIGLGASIGGVVQLIVVAVVLRVGRQIVAICALLAVPFVLSVLGAFWLAAEGDTIDRLIASVGVIVLWGAWLMVVPSLRRITLGLVRSMLARRGADDPDVAGTSGTSGTSDD